jgi:OmpA-OmpF porin, OOP family
MISKVNFSINTLCAITVLGLSAFSFGKTFSADSYITDPQTIIKPVSSDLSQVVFYNDKNNDKNKVANIYLDKHLQSSLKPGEYTQFCVMPGEHTIESYMNDEPEYKGKRESKSMAILKADHTYFLSATASGIPVSVSSEIAAKRLPGYLITSVKNRAVSAVACKYGQTSENASIQFPFGKYTVDAITPEEMAKLKAFAAGLVKTGNYQKIQVIGFTDSIGQLKQNFDLSQQRANSVSDELKKLGIRPSAISALGAGSNGLQVECQTSDKNVKIQCEQGNRRVLIYVTH